MIKKYISNLPVILTVVTIITYIIVLMYTNIHIYLNVYSENHNIYTAISQNNWAFWPEHNKNVQSPLLSYISFFTSFPFFINFLFLFLSGYLIYTLINTLFINQSDKFKLIKLFLYILSTFLIFSKLQMINLLWESQQLFFIEQFFTLLAFYLPLQFKKNKNFILLFLSLLSIIISILLNQTNIIILIPYILFIILIQVKYYKIIAAVCLFIFVILVYNYTHIFIYNSIDLSLVFTYFLTYLGGIFFDISGHDGISISILAGIFLISTTLYFIFCTLRNKTKPIEYTFITSYLLFYICQAYIITLHDLSQSTHLLYKNQYVSSSLLSWSLIFILYTHYLYKSKKYFSVVYYIGVLMILSLGVYQFNIFKNSINPQTFRQKLNVLKLKLHQNVEYRSVWHPIKASFFESIKVKKLIENNESVFSFADFKPLFHKIHTLPHSNMWGYVDKFKIIQTNDTPLIKIVGWSYDNINHHIPPYLYIIDENKSIVGYAISGTTRRDVSKIHGLETRSSGFVGYIYSKNPAEIYYLIDNNLTKKSMVKLPINITNIN